MRQIQHRCYPRQLAGKVQRKHAKRLAEVDEAEHKAKQYAYCSECGAKVTLVDLNANECAECGAQLLKKVKA